MQNRRFLLPQLRRRSDAERRKTRRGLVRTGDEGFSIIEVIVAIGVFSVIATFMTAEMSTGLRGVLGGKRREVATQEANRTLEIARSLSYEAIGLVQSDSTIATDPAIQTQSGKLSYRSASVWEPLFWATSTAGHPFNPHKLDITRGSTSLTRYIYVTGVDSDNNGSIDLKRVLVRVTWNNSGSPGPANEVRAQTLIDKNGLLPAGTGGGTTPLTATTSSTSGSLTVTSALLGLTAPLNVTFPTSSGTSSFRAVSKTSCTTKSAAMSALNLVNLPPDSVSVTADDDSRTTISSQPGQQSKPGALGIPAGPVANLVGTAVNSPISCDASVNPLAHEVGTGSSLGTLTAQTNVVGLGGLLNWLLTVASVQTSPITQQIDHEIVGGHREAAASTTGASGLVNVLKLPAAGISDGLVRVDTLAYGASVRSSETTPSQAPAVTAPVINLRIYDNANKLSGCTSHSGGYCVIAVDPSAGGFNGLSFSVTHNFTQLLGLNVINVSYTTNVDILPPSKSPAAGVVGANGEKRWTAEYTPIAITASLNASVLGVPLIDAAVDLNLGSVRADACAGATC